MDVISTRLGGRFGPLPTWVGFNCSIAAYNFTHTIPCNQEKCLSVDFLVEKKGAVGRLKKPLTKADEHGKAAIGLNLNTIVPTSGRRTYPRLENTNERNAGI